MFINFKVIYICTFILQCWYNFIITKFNLLFKNFIYLAINKTKLEKLYDLKTHVLFTLTLEYNISIGIPKNWQV